MIFPAIVSLSLIFSLEPNITLTKIAKKVAHGNQFQGLFGKQEWNKVNHNITRKIIIKILTRRNQFYIPIIIHNCDPKTIMCGKLNGFPIPLTFPGSKRTLRKYYDIPKIPTSKKAEHRI